MKQPLIIHLIDDTTPGGVTRVVDHIVSSERLAQTGRHVIRFVPKGALALPRIRADVIVSHMTISWRLLPALIALRATNPSTPIIHVEHSYTQSFTALNVAHRDRFYSLLRTGFALFDHVVPVSRAQGSWMVTRGLVPSQKCTVIQSAVDLTEFETLPAPSGKPRVFGALGRLVEQKGFDALIQAFVQVDAPDIELKIFGDGAMRSMLEKLAADDPRISLLGHRGDPVSAMAEIDTLLVPSRWEAFGLVAQEAMAARRCVIVSDVDGLNDQIQDGAIGVGGGVDCWVDAIRRARDLDLSNVAAHQKTFADRKKTAFERGWEGLLLRSFNRQLRAA